MYVGRGNCCLKAGESDAAPFEKPWLKFRLDLRQSLAWLIRITGAVNVHFNTFGEFSQLSQPQEIPISAQSIYSTEQPSRFSLRSFIVR